MNSNTTSSSLRLGDLSISLINGSVDVSIIDNDLASDTGLTTAVLLSIFMDRRSMDDDPTPSGDTSDRRGSWRDQFNEIDGDKMGSRMWLLDRSKRTGEVIRQAEEYVREALDWMIDDRVVSKIEVSIETSINGLMFSVVLLRPDRDNVSLKFSHVWT